MAVITGTYASQLRFELLERSRLWARGRAHVESYGSSSVVVYAPDEGRHGNFFDPAYQAILAWPDWLRRFNKIHAQAARALPKPQLDPQRRWRELDSSMSSDALLMNVFCTPGVVHSTTIWSALGLDSPGDPVFGWKAHVPLINGRVDRTEVDMRIGSLLVEAKLTESDFQCREAHIVESYRDFDEVFNRDLLPRAELTAIRPRSPAEFPEAFSQEFESLIDTAMPPALLEELHENSASALAAEAFNATRESEPGYQSYQLIRNVLAAHATESSFCVLHDARRPDLREAWFQIITAVKSADLRTRLKVLTWQELAAFLPEELQQFLDLKYGIVPPGRIASPIGSAEAS